MSKTLTGGTKEFSTHPEHYKRVQQEDTESSRAFKSDLAIRRFLKDPNEHTMKEAKKFVQFHNLTIGINSAKPPRLTLRQGKITIVDEETNRFTAELPPLVYDITVSVARFIFFKKTKKAQVKLDQDKSITLSL